MDSDTYFWQDNGGESGILQSSLTIERYMQQTQQQDITSSESSKSSPVATTSNAFLKNGTFSAEKADETSPATAGDASLPVEIVNPDAIEPKSRSYTCRICQETFPNKSAVTVHSRLHTDHQGKPYRCNFCSKGFSTNFYLKQHERIHSGQKPYKCPMCDHSFKQLSHVQQHVRTHTGVRPYKCHWPGCGKAFLQQSHLKSHEDRHIPKGESSPSRPYKCHWPDCGKSFAQLTNLKSHVARHIPGKGKGRKGANSSKKTETVEQSNDNAFGLMSPQNVINQAAAAANIGPGMLADEEAEIRPFLCPGCSKLYVREATFKKHLEECKTKLQMSISATASALGIDPPPVTIGDGGFDPNVIQITTVPSSTPPPLKKLRTDIKTEDDFRHNQQGFVLQQVNNLSTGVSGSPSLPNRNSNPHVKEEVFENTQPKVAITNFVSRRHLSEESDFKLPEMVDASTLYGVHSSEPQINLQSHQHAMTMQANEGKSQMAEQPSRSSPHPNNLILTSHNSQARIGASTMSSHVNTSSPLLHLATSSEEKGIPTSEHSTINEAAIRWQWDQSVPRLNYP